MSSQFIREHTCLAFGHGNVWLQSMEFRTIRQNLTPAIWAGGEGNQWLCIRWQHHPTTLKNLSPFALTRPFAHSYWLLLTYLFRFPGEHPGFLVRYFLISRRFNIRLKWFGSTYEIFLGGVGIDWFPTVTAIAEDCRVAWFERKIWLSEK